MSWKPEVIADASGKWVGNSLRFASEAEAEAYAQELWRRWVSVVEFRAVEDRDPVTHYWDEEKQKAQSLPF